MTQKNEMSRRDALKLFTAGTGATVLGLLGLNAIGAINITGPRLVSAQAGPAPRFGEGIAPNSPDRLNNPNSVEALLPAEWPETAEAAATKFGGQKEYWRRDLYLDSQSKTQWGGTWVMDAYALRVPFNNNGEYVNADGQPLSEQEVFDFSRNIDKVDVNFGPYAQNFQAHGTAWDGEQYWAGYGKAVFDDAIQAVVRPIVMECLPGQDSVSSFKDEAWKRTAQEFSKFLFNDQNADNIVAGLWSEDKEDFKLVQGRGWKDRLTSWLKNLAKSLGAENIS